MPILYGSGCRCQASLKYQLDPDALRCRAAAREKFQLSRIKRHDGIRGRARLVFREPIDAQPTICATGKGLFQGIETMVGGLVQQALHTR